MNEVLRYGLESLEMLDGEGNSTGLVKVEPLDMLQLDDFSIDEIIAIENALFFGVQYVYFRRFENRASIPQVYIYDYTTTVINDNDIISLHQRLYSSGNVPMFFIFTNNEVRIFNCYDKPAKGNQLIYKPLEVISLAAEIADLFNSKNQRLLEKFKAFSGRSFDNGSFWDDSPFSKHFQFANSAYEKLLTELKQSLHDIVDKKILPAEIARKIMVISILIKYLEERTDDNQNSVFPKAGQERISVVDGKRKKVKFDTDFFDQFSKGAKCFTDVLKKKGGGLKLLKYLGAHFNGGIFKLTQNEKASLEQTDLTRFALFLEGNLQGAQYVFWRLYSFNDLPVELISNIYEEFLEKSPGVVYTPPYLVNFMLDETMPLTDDAIDFKILDPACGSGVFLVGAYRRLIYRWRKQNEWKKPRLSILKRLLKNNIYGSDKDDQAVNLTIFSLSLALCDELSPLEIWDSLQFDDLTEENIFAKDFFDLLYRGIFTEHTYDLVIGNPPFESKLTACAAAIEMQKSGNRKLPSDLIDDRKNVIKLPDNQIALLFLEQSIHLCKPGKVVCLIQPSGPFLYNNSSSQFRKYLLENFHTPQIIDFTHISRVLFGKNGDVATAAIFIKNERPKSKTLLHLTVRRTKTNKEKIYFELDNHDFHYIPYKIAINDCLIWKSNLLTGARSHHLIARLSGLKTIETFLDQKRKDGWVANEGFTAATQKDIKTLEQLEAQKSKSPEAKEAYNKYRKKLTADMTGKPFLPTTAFREKGIDEKSITDSLKIKYFHSKGDYRIYEPPHVLIKEIAGDKIIPIALRNDFISFRNDIIGIHAPKTQQSELKLFFQEFQANQKLFLFYLAGSSGRYMVNKATSLLKDDVMNLPYPGIAEKNMLVLDEYEKIVVDDVLNYLLEFKRNGENSKIATNDANADNLKAFGKIFCEVLNSVYVTLKMHAPFMTDSYICFPFYFKDKPAIQFDNAKLAEQQIEKLVTKVAGLNLRLTRIVRLYEGNVIYLIKPKKLRYWLQSNALRDADETFTDLRKQGF